MHWKLHLPSLLVFPTLGNASPYPSKDEITAIFSHLTGTNSSYSSFFSHVSPAVNWTIQGTHPAAGQYTNRTLLEATFARINAIGSKERPLALTLTNIVGGGVEEWSVQELEVLGYCKNGLKFDNRYAWATRWNTNATIVEARAYLDSMLVSQALQQNELGILFTYNNPRNVLVPFVELSEAIALEATGLS
ncbi:hypothetical protein GGI43DRAFT_385286 [Trichoderma evansii]